MNWSPIFRYCMLDPHVDRYRLEWADDREFHHKIIFFPDRTSETAPNNRDQNAGRIQSTTWSGIGQTFPKRYTAVVLTT